MKSLIKILRYIKPYKLFAFLSVLSNVFSVIFHLLSLLVLIPFLQLLFGKTEPVTAEPEFSWTSDFISDYISFQMTPHIEANGLMGALYYLCIAVAVLFFAKNLFRYLAKFFLAYIRSGVVRDIRSDVYGKILILPLSFYSEEKKGDIISRITGDVQEIEWSIMNSLEMLFRDPISIVLSLVFMISISPELTVFSFILLPISGIIIGRIGKSLKRTSAKLQVRMGELLSNVEETLTGLRIIKAFNAENEANKRFAGQNELYRNTMLSMFRKRDLASPMSEFLGSLVMVTLLWFGGSMVVDPAMNFDGEDFIAYITMFSQLLNPAKSLSTAYYNIQKGAASTERIDAVLEADVKIFDNENAHSKKSFEGELKYENVSFAYEDKEVLSSINLSVRKGQTVALVGPSGGGKSTMVDLLPRFYDTKSGAITIDGEDVRNVRIKDLRGLMGIVSQQSILFNDTVFNNIALGFENPTIEEVVEAAKIANAHEFIEKLPEGYYTNIGDGGGKLSGGQKQRLSIARAVLKNPPIMILDEATSALDTESEKLVQEALFKLMQNRTSIVIAHRLSTIQNADSIVVIENGQIVERGNHAELIAKAGVYKKLTDLQAFA